ncbi:MAG: DUF480 domain-containing protein [Planctomycetota bacterium]
MVEPFVLRAAERRVIGVLIEKSLSTPQYYPMTLNALVAGCNQKNNREPLVEYIEEEVSQVLDDLKSRNLVTVVYPASGRTEKWRQELTASLELDGPQKAIIGELLLRGAQSLGELRQRASRMKPIADLPTLEAVLETLRTRPWPLIVRLTEAGVKRGVRVTHNFYEPREMAALREVEARGAELESGGFGSGGETAASHHASAGGAGSSSTAAAVRAELDAVRARLERIERHLGLQ